MKSTARNSRTYRQPNISCPTTFTKATARSAAKHEMQVIKMPKNLSNKTLSALTVENKKLFSIEALSLGKEKEGLLIIARSNSISNFLFKPIILIKQRQLNVKFDTTARQHLQVHSALVVKSLKLTKDRGATQLFLTEKSRASYT